MNLRFACVASLLSGIVLLGSTDVGAIPPWRSLIPIKRVEADANKSYELTDEAGPWMILAATYTSPNATQEAHELVIELRRRFKMKAYVHRQKYDFTEPVYGIGLNKYGGPKRMKHLNSSSFVGAAVLVGDFESVDDKSIDKTLDKIKHMTPECLDLESGKWTLQRTRLVQHIRRKLDPDDEKNLFGPLGSAFVTRNPLLPEEFFVPSGPDQFVINMNKDVEFSLLDNPGRYTVRVGTFRGNVTMDLKQIEKLERGSKMKSKLDEAALNAHRLTLALRKRGYDAYEFHDRFESICTVGSFDSLGTKSPDGRTTELNPGIHSLMMRFGAQRQNLPGMAEAGLMPATLDGVSLDVQPIPVEVPKKSIGAAYARRN